METLGAAGLIVAAIGLYTWLVLRRLGVGQPGGKPDCGCGKRGGCKS